MLKITYDVLLTVFFIFQFFSYFSFWHWLLCVCSSVGYGCIVVKWYRIGIRLLLPFNDMRIIDLGWSWRSVLQH